MQLPSKLQSGMNFKTSTVQAVNQIIDYLKTQRLVSDNKTIRLNQLTSGIAISTIQNPTAKGSGGEAFDHPFKLKIVTDENGKQNVPKRFLGTFYKAVTANLFILLEHEPKNYVKKNKKRGCEKENKKSCCDFVVNYLPVYIFSPVLYLYDQLLTFCSYLATKLLYAFHFYLLRTFI